MQECWSSLTQGVLPADRLVKAEEGGGEAQGFGLAPQA